MIQLKQKNNSPVQVFRSRKVRSVGLATSLIPYRAFYFITKGLSMENNHTPQPVNNSGYLSNTRIFSMLAEYVERTLSPDLDEFCYCFKVPKERLIEPLFSHLLKAAESKRQLYLFNQMTRISASNEQVVYKTARDSVHVYPIKDLINSDIHQAADHRNTKLNGKHRNGILFVIGLALFAWLVLIGFIWLAKVIIQWLF